jgi:NTP pyrophosphatase (non-canonical NTP hydrolase)
MAYNDLTDAEAERLAILAEELGEAQQAVGKILRHGYNSYDPGDPHKVTNTSYLEKELGDVKYIISLMCKMGDVYDKEISYYARKKAKKIGQYLHHQGETK